MLVNPNWVPIPFNQHCQVTTGRKARCKGMVISRTNFLNHQLMDFTKYEIDFKDQAPLFYKFQISILLFLTLEKWIWEFIRKNKKDVFRHLMIIKNFFFFFNLFYLFIYLFIWLLLGLRCCARAFSSCSKQGLLFVAVLRLLIVVASLVVEHGL